MAAEGPHSSSQDELQEDSREQAVWTGLVRLRRATVAIFSCDCLESDLGLSPNEGHFSEELPVTCGSVGTPGVSVIEP